MPLTQAELEAMARAPAQVATDAISETERPADDVAKLAALAANAGLDSGTNSNGGRKSAWRQVRPARSLPPGAI